MSDVTEMLQVTPSERRCVVFDFDGTLGDTLPAIVRTAREALLDFGMKEEDLGDLSRLVGPAFPDAFEEVYGLTSADAAEVTRRFRGIYNVLGAEAWPPFPGIKELLADLHASGRLVAVASAKRNVLIERCIKDCGFEPYLSAASGRVDDASDNKVKVIKRVLAACGVTSADAVMVGDRFYDVEAARLAGLPCVGVYLGNTAPAGELEAAGAVAVAHSVQELRTILLGCDDEL